MTRAPRPRGRASVGAVLIAGGAVALLLWALSGMSSEMFFTLLSGCAAVASVVAIGRSAVAKRQRLADPERVAALTAHARLLEDRLDQLETELRDVDAAQRFTTELMAGPSRRDARAPGDEPR